MWLAKSISRVANSTPNESAQALHKVSLTHRQQALLGEHAPFGCCYWDDRVLPPSQLFPDLLPLSLTQTVDKFLAPENIVSFFLRM